VVLAIAGFGAINLASAQGLPSIGTSVIPASEQAAGIPVDEILDSITAGGLLTRNAETIASIKTEGIVLGAETPTTSPEQNSNPKPVALNTDSIPSLESDGGLLTGPQAAAPSDDTTIFKLASRFLSRVVFRAETEFQKRPKFEDGFDISGTPTFDQDTAGYAVIKKGNQSVQIDFDQAYDNPPVVTASLSLQQYKDSEVAAAAADLLLVSDVKYIVTNVNSKGFEIIMDRPAESDIPFSWHALAVQNPKTFKKEGNSLKNTDSSPAIPDMSQPAQNNKKNNAVIPPLPGIIGQSNLSQSNPQGTGMSAGTTNPAVTRGGGN